MGLLSDISKAVLDAETKSVVPTGVQPYQPTHIDVYQKRRAPRPIELVRECLGTAYTCATLNSDLVASARLRLYVRTRRGQEKSRLARRGKTMPVGKADLKWLQKSRATSAIVNGADVEEVIDHPVIDLVNSPNGDGTDGVGFSLYELIELTQRYLEIVGKAFWYAQRDGVNEMPTQIWILPPQFVQEIPGMDSERLISKYRYAGSGMRVTDYKPEDVVPFRVPDAMNPYTGGSSPMRACFEQVRIFREYNAQTLALLENGGRPDALWSPKGDDMGTGIGEAEARRMRLALRQAFSMAGRGGIFVSEVPGSLQPLTWSTNEIMSPEVAAQLKASICNCFQVPTTKVDRSDATLASAKTGDISHARDAGIPRTNRFASTLNSFLLPMYDDPDRRLFFAFDSCVPDDEPSQMQYLGSGVTNGAVLRNEYREACGLPSVPWGDTPLVPSNMLSADDAGKPVQPTNPLMSLLAAGQQQPSDSGNQPQEGEGGQAAATQMNGAQIASALQIVVSVVAGDLPRDSGLAMLQQMFGMTPEQAEAMMASAGNPNAPTTPNPNPNTPAVDVTQQPTDAAKSGDNGADAVGKATKKKGGEVIEKSGSTHEYSCVMAPIGGQASADLLSASSAIPDEDLADDGREGETHVTVLYGLHTESSQDVVDVLKTFAPAKIKFGKTKVFYANENRDSDVVVVEIISDDLVAMNKALRDKLEYTSNYPDYKPHATVAYVTSGKGDDYAEAVNISGEYVCDHLVFSGKDNSRSTIPLPGTENDGDGASGEPTGKVVHKINETANGLARPLPDGAAIAGALRTAFSGQRKDILDQLNAYAKSVGVAATKDERAKPLPAIDADGIPTRFIPISKWDDDIAHQVQPVIEIIAKNEGEKILQRVGASPDVFAVFEKRIPEAAQKLALKFAKSTNETTSMKLNEALASLRQEISDGLVEGDSVKELTKRVNAIFDEATEERAQTIAQTEASRAAHAGEMAGAKDSGVVSRKGWLASADCCDSCAQIAAKGFIPLDQTFAEIGGPYGSIDGPPLHPLCECSLTYEIDD